MGLLELEMLPESVTELIVGSLEDFSKSGARYLQRLTINKYTSPTKLRFEDLPSRLLYLTLPIITEVTPQELSALPSTLISLSLPALKLMTIEHVKALPRGLHILKMINCDHFTDLLFPLLPPHLHVLHCTWTDEITDNLVNSVPKTLYRLVLKARIPDSCYTMPFRDQPSEYQPPIDDYISIASQFPRALRWEFYSNATSQPWLPRWDTYYFEVDAINGKLGVHDISPRWTSPITPIAPAPSQPEESSIISWFKKVFS